MSFLRQLLLSAAVIAAGLYVWITYVPSAHPVLERLGVAQMLGVELQTPPEQAGGRRGFGGGAARVVAGTVTERTLADRVRAIGDGKALRAVTVRSESVGLVIDILVTPGTPVEAGSTMVRLENEAETIALERAQIMLEDARDDLSRVRQLQDNVTEVRRREAELALRTAELGLREARYNLEKRVIVAPIAGRVGLIDVEIGDRVAAQDALATVSDRSSLLIDFRVPERVIPQLEIGMPFVVTPLGLEDTVLQARISAIDTIVDRASRTLRVQGRLGNPDDRLRAGMAFDVELTFPGDTLLSIPPLALQWSSEGAFVWAIREGQAVAVPVRIRQRNADDILVEAPLEPGEQIVVEGVQTLRPGAEVEVTNSPEAARADLVPARL